MGFIPKHSDKTSQQRGSLAQEPRTTNGHLSLAAGWPNDAEMLTAKDLEAWLKIDVKTIYSYVQRGLVPYVRIQSNVRFVRSQILEWIQEHSYRPRSLKTNRKHLGNGT